MANRRIVDYLVAQIIFQFWHVLQFGGPLLIDVRDLETHEEKMLFVIIKLVEELNLYSPMEENNIHPIEDNVIALNIKPTLSSSLSTISF